jgi:tetratricopeptide (TPR) repeat protein
LKRFLPILLIAAAVLIPYAPSARNGFVWDDTALLLRDPLIRSWRLIPEGFQHFLFTDATASDFYRPIQRLSYTLEYVVFGLEPTVFHVTSVLCHLAAALALFAFSRELLRLLNAGDRANRWGSLAAAVVWAVHPVHSSAVVYISGRADPLAAAFGFIGLYLVLVSLRTGGAASRIFTLAAGVACLLSALSKEAGLIFLALWLAIVLLQKNRTAALKAIVVALFVIVSYASLRMAAEHNPAPRIRSPAPALVRPILAARAVAEYAGLLILPVNLRMERDVETHPAGHDNAARAGMAWKELQTLAGILLIAGFVRWLLRARTRDRAAFTCLVLTALSYLPVSGLFSLNASIAEHWLYVPSAFLFLALAISVARALESAPVARRFRPVAIFALAGWLVFLSARTFLRTFDWKAQRTFLERTIAAGGDSPRMLINLAGWEMNYGSPEEATKHLDAALRKEPDQPIAVLNRAALAIKMNEFETARELLKRATQMPLVEAQAHELLAVLAHKENGTSDLQRMRLASRTGPPNWTIQKRYVKLLAENGATDRAIDELKRILVTQWYRADTWRLLAELLASNGQGAAAVEALKRAHDYDVHLHAPAPAP